MNINASWPQIFEREKELPQLESKQYKPVVLYIYMYTRYHFKNYRAVLGLDTKWEKLFSPDMLKF